MSSVTWIAKLSAHDQHLPQVPPNPSDVPELGVSALLSPSSRHSRRVAFLRYVLHASTFLRPFALQALPRFIATMAALTPGWPALRLEYQHEHRPHASQVSLIHVLDLPIAESPTT